MTAPTLLTEEQYLATFTPPMKDVTADAEVLVDIWQYADPLELCAFGIHGIFDVAYVYRDASDRYEHVLIETDKYNTLLVIAIDREIAAIVGHYVLDLNEKYGLD